MGNVPIAITGMHRSGTSMITRGLHDSGLHLIGAGAEELIDAAEDNPEGFWENKAIVACNDDLLEATGGAWDNPPDLAPQAVDDARVLHVAEAATAAIAALSEYEHWGFKDPRLCLTAPYWLDLLPDLRFVVCVRHPLEVALSLKRRNQNSYSLGLALWERYYTAALETIPPERRIVTHYDTFFVDPEGEFARLCAFAGLEPAPPRVRTDLRHHTVGVGLDDAGVSPQLRALYDDLCREAGAPLAPEPPSDEGRVRRLILDGAVAARHADQRQDAVERLQEREAQLQTEHRDRVRDLEAQLAAARKESLARVDAMLTVQRSVAQTEARVAQIDARTRAMAVRLESGPLRRTARAVLRHLPPPAQEQVRRLRRVARRGVADPIPTAGLAARSAVRHLPPPVRKQAGRARRVVRRSIADPVPTAKEVGHRLEPKARSAVQRLPPPAQQRVRAARTTAARLKGPLRRGVRRAMRDGRQSAGRAARGTVHRLPPDAQRQVRRAQRIVRRGAADPLPTAKTIAHRLPPPAERAARRAWRGARRLRAGGSARLLGSGGTRKTAAPPKGPAFKQWREGYERMVAAAVPQGVPWLVVQPGSPKEACNARTTRGTAYPNTPRNRPFADDLAHIAHLEGLRFEGYRYLVVPEGSRPWFRRQADLRDHVVRTYRTVVDEESAGAVFDLFEAAGPGTRSLRGEVDRLSAHLAHAPAVLDWTSFELASELPGEATFAPPPGDRLPYLDRSVEIVVIDGTHDRAEAQRVASHGVITIAAGPSGIEVRDVEDIGALPGAAGARVLVISEAADADDGWRTQLSARAAESGADVRFGAIDAAGVAVAIDHDVVVVVERYVLPLPGAIATAANLAAASPESAFAGKVLRADGRLEAAGGTVFSDRSVALIAGGSAEVSAPWHEYARPVCWAPGLVAAAASLWTRAPALVAAGAGRSFLREWCAAVWAHGGEVVYEPTVAAVRVTGDGGEPSVPLHSSSWQRVLDLRPTRPADLTDGAWRYLLAHDDVEACRR